MTHDDGTVAALQQQVERLERRLAELESAPVKRRSAGRWPLLAALAVLVVSAAAWAQLKTFVANTPALASDINSNFTLLNTNIAQLKTWLEQKVGTAGNAEVRVQTGTTSNAATAAGKALFVSASTASGAESLIEVRHDNLTQGIGIGFNTISAVGTNGNVDLILQAKGVGSVTFPGNIDIGLEVVKCTNVASGSDCSCPAGKRVLGGGSYCAGNNWHVNTSFPSSTTAWQGWCEDSAGTNVNTDTYVLCARVR
ncbi:MAG: hypothetical protein K1X89_03380 [Myxococcaceae bacterium]|nr:hypothetical protein [Myxococcaceae bacterium]